MTIGRRTVSSALRSVGLSSEKRFHKYYRVLSLAKWSAYKASSILLQVLVDCFAPQGVLVFGIDETIERRRGAKIKTKGIYRDPVRSSKSHFVKCSGLRWISLMLLTPISWADRVWALPFLTVLAPSKRYNEKQGKRHKKLTDWAKQMMLQLSRWLPNRLIIIVADFSYAVIELLAAVRQHVCVITRLRLDAALYDFVPPRPKGRPGRNRKKGARLKNLEHLINDPTTQWTKLTIPQWYNHGSVQMLVATGTAIWYHSGMTPLPIRWVLIKDPKGRIKPTALLCTKLDLTIARSTPVLMALFTLITIWADELNHQKLINIKPCAWYQKSHPTFSDAIASVRR